jgi:hypothetical protein
MPPPQAYDSVSPERGGGNGNNRVEQRRNPDGSTSIQIGGHRNSGPATGAAGGSGESPVTRGNSTAAGNSDLMLDNENNEYGEDAEADESK